MKSIFILFLFVSTSVFSQESFWDNLPEPIGFVNDFENILSQEEEKELNKLIAEYEKKTTVEITIVTIPTSATSEEKFNDLSLYIAKSWGVGKKAKNNGILIAISKGYSRIRIQNGLGIEQIITDEETKKLIDEKMIPHFKKSNYNTGLKNGVKEYFFILKKYEKLLKFDETDRFYTRDSLVLNLSDKNITVLDTNAVFYWEMIKRGEKSIPILIDCLSDTTLTNIYDKCKKGYLTVGDICYFALDEIAEFPAFLVTNIEFCTIDVENNCWSFYYYLFENQNKPQFKIMVREFYTSNDYYFKLFKKDEMTPERIKFNITGKLELIL